MAHEVSAKRVRLSGPAGAGAALLLAVVVVFLFPAAARAGKLCVLKYDGAEEYRSGTPCTDAADGTHTVVRLICGEPYKLAVVYEQDQPAVKLGSYQLSFAYEPGYFSGPSCNFNPKKYFDMSLVTDCPSTGKSVIRGAYFNDAATGWSQPYPSGVELIDVEYAAFSYDPDAPPPATPTLVFDPEDSLVYDFDINQLDYQIMDAYVVCRNREFEAPVVVDNQGGDDVWRAADPGAVYDVDFTDSGGSMLWYAQYAVWGGPGMSGGKVVDWTVFAERINSNLYSSNWGVAFQQLPEGVSYVSARAGDWDGNVSDVATDVFYVKKNTAAPGEVSGMSAAGWDSMVSLAWTNPEDRDFESVKVVRKTGDYPGGPSDGEQVYYGSGTAAVDSGLVNGTKYYYAAFAYDQGGLNSAGAVSGARAEATPDVESGLVLHAGWNQSGAARAGAAVPASAFAAGEHFSGAYSGGSFIYATQSGEVPLPLGGSVWIYSSMEPGAVNAGGSENAASSHDVSLSAGWGEFSPPFESSLPWDAGHAALTCGGSPAALPAVYHYENETYVKIEPDAGQSLRPWKGYAIKAPGACVLRLSK